MESLVAALPAGGAAAAAAFGGLVAAAALAGKVGLLGSKKHLNAPPGQSPDMIPRSQSNAEPVVLILYLARILASVETVYFLLRCSRLPVSLVV